MRGPGSVEAVQTALVPERGRSGLAGHLYRAVSDRLKVAGDLGLDVGRRHGAGRVIFSDPDTRFTELLDLILATIARTRTSQSRAPQSGRS